MPAPTPSQLTQATLASYQGGQGSPHFSEYLSKLFGALSSAWQTWQDGLAPSGILVTGSGAGAWTGVGAKGALTGGTLSATPFSFGADSPYQIIFQRAVFDAAAAEFTRWASTFTFTAVNYTGTSSATPSNPGSAQAFNVPSPIGTAGSGSNPSQIHQLILARLTPPNFDLSNPEAGAGNFAKALATGIETTFATWLTTALFSGDEFNAGVGAGGAASEVPSKQTGRIV